MVATANEPPLHFFDLRLDGTDHEQLRQFGVYWLWSGGDPPDAPPLRLLEWTPAGVADLTTEHYSLHAVQAGTQHHIAGLFGYWLESDADHLWVQVPRGDHRYYLLIAGGRRGVNRQHTIRWRCPECGNELGEPVPLAHDGTPQSFLRAEAAAVAAFNTDAARRRCTACGALHPPTHGFRAGGQSSAGMVTAAVAEAQAPLAFPVRLADLPEAVPTRVQTDGRELVLVRLGNVVRAVASACPHKGGPLALGEVRGGTITCPWHRFRFDLASGECVTNPRLCVPTYRIDVHGDQVLLASAPTAEEAMQS